MTKEELAVTINGREVESMLTSFEQEQARINGLVIICGASDDLVEFDGFIRDEIGAYQGTDFVIAIPGDEIPVDEEEETYRKAKTYEPIPILNDSINTRNKFSGKWSPDELDCSWLIKTSLPHAHFDVMDDGELFCRGMVIDIKDLIVK